MELEDLHFNKGPIPTIKYKDIIEENIIFLNDDHENKIVKRLDEITLDKPTLIVRKNPETWEEESLPLTERILNFLKENREKYGEEFSFDIYIDYSFRQVNSVKEMEEKEDVYHATPISEEEFMESEMKYWTYEPTETEKEQAESVLNAVKAFHNMKWHNGDEFWKYKNPS